jgi:hypothetical protein
MNRLSTPRHEVCGGDAGRLRAHCRAPIQDLQLVIDDVPEDLEPAVRHLFERDIRRRHYLLKTGGAR